MIKPIPISERLPQPYNPDQVGAQDLDPQGWCWYGTSFRANARPCWTYDIFPADEDTHWLPWWALPVPDDMAQALAEAKRTEWAMRQRLGQ